MHSRNRYKHASPSFEKLAEAHASLKPFLSFSSEGEEGAGFDSKQPGAVEELVKAMLCVDFGIKSYVGVPKGYLVPSVTRSLNYLHFMEDLLRKAEDNDVILRNAPRRGLDVGVGASCIFPLLGCALHPDWTFCGVDVVEGAIQSARTNAEQFSSRIEIKHSDMLNAVVEDKFDFMLCNPPFFSSSVPNPGEYRPFGGRELERSCEGGEVAFVSRLIDQSATRQGDIVWCSSMLGIKESLRAVLAKLHHLRPSLVEAIHVYRLEQGHTFRWVVAWSFHKAFATTAFVGRELCVSNLKENESLEARSNQALGMLRNYSVDTGVCGNQQYRFRLRVVLFPAEPYKFRVDVLDLMDHQDGSAAAKAARSAQNRVEQDITRTSRKWKKKS